MNRYTRYAAYFLIGLIAFVGVICMICGAVSTTVRGTFIYGGTGIILSLSALGLGQLLPGFDRSSKG